MGRFSGGALFLLCASSLTLVRCSCGETDSDSGSKKKDASIEASSDAGEELVADGNIDGELDAGVPGITAGACGTLEWEVDYGGDEKGHLSSDEAVLGLATDDAGNVYATGRYRGDAD